MHYQPLTETGSRQTDPTDNPLNLFWRAIYCSIMNQARLPTRKQLLELSNEIDKHARPGPEKKVLSALVEAGSSGLSMFALSIVVTATGLSGESPKRSKILRELVRAMAQKHFNATLRAAMPVSADLAQGSPMEIEIRRIFENAKTETSREKTRMALHNLRKKCKVACDGTIGIPFGPNGPVDITKPPYLFRFEFQPDGGFPGERRRAIGAKAGATPGVGERGSTQGAKRRLFLISPARGLPDLTRFREGLLAESNWLLDELTGDSPDAAELGRRLDGLTSADSVVYFGASTGLRADVQDECARRDIAFLDIERAREDVIEGVPNIVADRAGGGRALGKAVAEALFWGDPVDPRAESEDPVGGPEHQTTSSRRPVVFVFSNGDSSSEWLAGCSDALREDGRLELQHSSTKEVLARSCQDSTRAEFNSDDFRLDDELAGRLLGVYVLNSAGKLGTSGTPTCRPFWDRSVSGPADFAIITSSCQVAQGVLDVLALSGIRVPQDGLLASINPGASRYGAFLTKVGAAYFQLGKAATRNWTGRQNADDFRAAPLLKLRSSTNHWLSKIFRATPASLTIREATAGTLVAANPYCERLLGRPARELRGKAPSDANFWGPHFGKEIELADRVVRRGERLISLERWDFSGNYGKQRVTLRFPLFDEEQKRITHLASISLPSNTMTREDDKHGASKRGVMSPAHEEEEFGLDPEDERLLERFFEQIPLSVLIRVADESEPGDREFVYYANESSRRLFALEAKQGRCSERLSRYLRRPRPGRKPEAPLRVLGFSHQRLRSSNEYGEYTEWGAAAPKRGVLEFDLLNGLFVRAAEGSIGYDWTYAKCAANSKRFRQENARGLVECFRIERREDHAGLYLADPTCPKSIVHWAADVGPGAETEMR